MKHDNAEAVRLRWHAQPEKTRTLASDEDHMRTCALEGETDGSAGGDSKADEAARSGVTVWGGIGYG
jgi:hypothetical protein